MSHDLLARFVVARELWVVALVDRALETLLLALAVEHPSLADHDQPARAPTLRRARAVVRLAFRLRHALVDYRLAVDTAISQPGDHSVLIGCHRPAKSSDGKPICKVVEAPRA